MKNIFAFIRRYFIFLSFIILQIACIVILTKSSKTHEAFFSAAANETTKGINKQYSDLKSYFSLKQTNKALQIENARLRNLLLENFKAIDTSYVQKIDSLIVDSLQKFRKYTYLPANVIGNTVTLPNNYLIVERGSLQGVKKGMAVISSSGIVGVVVDVSQNVCKVMSLLHQNSKVSAMLKKDNIAGSLEWDGSDPDMLTLRNIPKSSKIVRGDTVLTSTYSANFPSHQLVGTVIRVEKEAATNFVTVKLKPATNFYNVQFVYLIDNTRLTEQTTIERSSQKNQ